MKYLVRMEFDIDSIGFGDIEVIANSPDEAREVAIDQFMNNTTRVDVEFYSSDTFDATLRKEDSAEWLVEEIV